MAGGGIGARVLYGSPLRTRRGGRLFTLAMFLLLTLALLGHLSLLLGDIGSAAPVFFAGIGVCAVWCVPAVLVLWRLDRRERESPWLLAGSLLWGAVIATGTAGVLNSLAGAGLMLYLVSSGLIDTQDVRRLREGAEPESLREVLGLLLSALAVPVLVAPLVEESVKGLAVLFLLWLLRAEFDDVRDGIVYGALVGLGFSITEYGLYLARQAMESGAPLTFDLLVLRQPFFGLNNHLLWTALTGAGLGLARQTARLPVRLLAPPAFFALAVTGHALQNSLGVLIAGVLSDALGYSPQTAGTLPGVLAAWLSSAVANLVPQAVPIGLLIGMLIASARWEIGVIRQYLVDEVGGGPRAAVTPQEYVLVSADRPFRTRRLPPYHGQRERAIVNAQNELAFRKWHLDREGGDAGLDPLVVAWRQDIADLRAAGPPGL
ncbi:MAG TPA: PrsW family intramembrane metalloprotease [Chloroflexota bacterium]|nr:PrsW family intramembrane metalloprotease [Chloroflexota bacterium]